MTAKQKILDRIREVGFVDNFWCIDNRITTRLGAVIHKLKEEGMVFEGKFGDNAHKKNFYYYLKKNNNYCCGGHMQGLEHSKDCPSQRYTEKVITKTYDSLF